jgi:hypothetical protein
MAAKKKAVPKKTAAKKAAPKSGRRPGSESVELLTKLKKLASRKDGVANIEAAGELGVTTLKCSALVARLVREGSVKTKKADNGRITIFAA